MYTTILNPDSSHRIHHSTLRTFLNAAGACVLVSGLISCGPPASDPPPGLSSHVTTGGTSPASATHGPGARAQWVGQTSDAGAIADKRSLPLPDQPPITAGTTDGGDSSQAPNIPESIAKDMGSPDARTRYRALDYWEAQDSKAPLDPVFKAMEDEDPAVRARATAIVEQYWAAEQERGKG